MRQATDQNGEGNKYFGSNFRVEKIPFYNVVLKLTRERNRLVADVFVHGTPSRFRPKNGLGFWSLLSRRCNHFAWSLLAVVTLFVKKRVASNISLDDIWTYHPGKEHWYPIMCSVIPLWPKITWCISVVSSNLWPNNYVYITLLCKVVSGQNLLS